MGNRANLVIVETATGICTTRTGRAAGCSTRLRSVPDHALRYIRAHRLCPKDEWTDPLWVDGGALVDVDRRRLLFFGDELMTSMSERRAMFEVLARTWPDYAVEWAYGGTDELSTYVGAERHWHLGRDGQPAKLARGRAGLCHLVSVVGADRLVRLWPLWWGYSVGWQGPSLLHSLPGKGVAGCGAT